MISKRGKRWIVRLWERDDSVPAGRRRIWIGTYDTRTEAREAEAKATLERGRGPRTRSWTIEEFAERWLNAYHGPSTNRPEPKTRKHNEYAINLFVRQHGKLRLNQFRQADARDFAGEYAWRAKVVAAMFEDAIRDGKITYNPFQGVRKPKGHGRKNIDPLTADEVERIAAIARDTLGFYGPHFALAIRTAAWTGMRPGELSRLTWRDIDWDRGTLSIRRTKTKVDRVIALPARVREDLAVIPRMTETVFHTSRGVPFRAGSYAWYWHQVRAVFEAEVPADHWLAARLGRNPDDHLDLMEFRHFCGSWLASKGLSAYEISQHLGNSERVCASTYVHPYRDAIRDKVRSAFDDWSPSQPQRLEETS